MTTVDREGRPHAVPVVFAVHDQDLVTPIDRKPSSSDLLGRLRNLERDPRVALLADRWSEEWTELAWVMIRGRASVQSSSHSVSEVEAIIARYPEYRDTLEGSDVIRIVPEQILWWSWA
jgi:Pyridoxamine 5''-phosphate oxidase.